MCGDGCGVTSANHSRFQTKELERFRNVPLMMGFKVRGDSDAEVGWESSDFLEYLGELVREGEYVARVEVLTASI